ncbi:MAG: dephospho-CoA kinase [Aquabacterium sp.]
MDGVGLTPVRSVGLTGGIGSGKSTVAQALVRLGAALVDTDLIARELTLPGGAAMPRLRQLFGDAIADPLGGLDRARMREIAFADSGARARLESVLHPMIGVEAQRLAASAPGWVVFDVPLLGATSVWRQRCDRILVVDCSEDTQVRRVVARSGWEPTQVRSVIAQQATRSSRRGIADAVLFNEGLSLAELDEAVVALWRLWIGEPEATL